MCLTRNRSMQRLQSHMPQPSRSKPLLAQRRAGHGMATALTPALALKYHRFMRFYRFSGPRRSHPRLFGLIAAAVVACTVAILAGCTPYPVPSVSEMTTTYQEHAAAFTQIAGWAKTDGDFALDAGAEGPLSNGLLPTREASYRKVMANLGAKRIESHDGELSVLFGSEGLGVSGVEWGYYFSSVSKPLSEEDSGYESTPVGGGWFGYVYRF